MVQRLKAFGIKLLGISVITVSFYTVFMDANLGSILLISIVIASVSYLGDLFILRKVNKLFAVFADFTLYFILYYFLGSIVVEGGIPLLIAAFAAAYVSGIGEAVFHIYMIDTVWNEQSAHSFPGKYQTEIAKETDDFQTAENEHTIKSKDEEK